MKGGRKRVHDHPVARTITIEMWLDILMEECKKIGIRPGDIIQAGMLSIFKADNKTYPALAKSFLIHITPKYESLKDTIEYYEREVQLQEALPKIIREKEPDLNESESTKWFDDFHAVKFLEDNAIFLIEKSAFAEAQTLFELQDDNVDLDWKKLPKYYSILAVMKNHSKITIEKEDAPA